MFLIATFAFAGPLVAGCGMPADPGTTIPTGTPSLSSSAPASVPAVTTPAPAPVITTEPPPVVPAPSVPPPAEAPPVQQPPAEGTACGADSYVNSDGQCVHDPVQAPAPPPGATARCNDGTYSFSKHHSGTCSGHHGVAEWLN